MQGRGATCQLRPPTRSRLSRSPRRRAGATLRLLSAGRRRSTRLRRARAVPRGLWSARTAHTGNAPARSLSSSVQDRAPTCELRPPTSSRHSRSARKRDIALAICGKEAQHARLLRARAVPRELWCFIHYRRALHYRRPFLIGARPWCDMQAAAFTLHSRLSRGPRMHATVLAVCGEEAQHARLLRARAVPRWLWLACHMKKYCTGEKPLSFGARPQCDMPSAASNAQSAFT